MSMILSGLVLGLVLIFVCFYLRNRKGTKVYPGEGMMSKLRFMKNKVASSPNVSLSEFEGIVNVTDNRIETSITPAIIGSTLYENLLLNLMMKKRVKPSDENVLPPPASGDGTFARSEQQQRSDSANEGEHVHVPLEDVVIQVSTPRDIYELDVSSSVSSDDSEDVV